MVKKFIKQKKQGIVGAGSGTGAAGGSDSSDDEDEDPTTLDSASDNNDEFDKKKFLKMLCNKFPSKYIASKYNAFDENTEKFTPAPAPAPATAPFSTRDRSSIGHNEILDHSTPKPKKIFITMTAMQDADDDDENDSDYKPEEDEEENEALNDNITVSSVSSVSDLSDISDISDDETAVATTTPIDEKTHNIYLRLKNECKKDPKNRALKKMAVTCKRELRQGERLAEKYAQKQRKHNKKLFARAVIEGTQEYNDIVYFDKSTIEEQKTLIKEARAIHDFTKLDKPYRIALIESNIPLKNKSQALKKINQMAINDTRTSEYGKNKFWVDNFMRIPFNKYAPAPFDYNTADASVDAAAFIVNAKKTLDSIVYGMDEAKMQIMQMIGQLIVNPTAVGTSIGICGPPGVGKSTLIKDGVSKILGRPFSMITLGGATDGAYLEGHSYTYEGAVWGRLVQILMDSKCMNPIIYFGELDKLSGTPKGDEIAGILTHLTDTTQNMEFHDKYFSDVDFDFSRAMFIFDYNDETLINPILRDRLYKIHVKEYEPAEKQIIAANYLMPRICADMKFGAGDLIIPAATISHIIHCFCGGEKGVRNLKRVLETIYRKLNLIRLIRGGGESVVYDPTLFGRFLNVGEVAFPFVVTPDIVNKLIERPGSNVSHLMMYT